MVLLMQILVAMYLRSEWHSWGAGKRSGARVLVASKVSGKWFFLFGFGKNERENIGNDELIQLQGTARLLLHLSETDIEKLLLIGELKELGNHDK